MATPLAAHADAPSDLESNTANGSPSNDQQVVMAARAFVAGQPVVGKLSASQRCARSEQLASSAIQAAVEGGKGPRRSRTPKSCKNANGTPTKGEPVVSESGGAPKRARSDQRVRSATRQPSNFDKELKQNQSPTPNTELSCISECSANSMKAVGDHSECSSLVHEDFEYDSNVRVNHSNIFPSMQNVVSECNSLRCNHPDLFEKPTLAASQPSGHNESTFENALRRDLHAFSTSVLMCLRGSWNPCGWKRWRPLQIFRAYWFRDELVKTLEVARDMKRATLSPDLKLFDFLSVQYHHMMNLGDFRIESDSSTQTQAKAATSLYLMTVTMLCLTLPTGLAQYLKPKGSRLEEWRSEAVYRAESVSNVLSCPIPTMHSGTPYTELSGAKLNLYINEVLNRSRFEEHVQHGYLIDKSWFDRPLVVASLGYKLALTMSLQEIHGNVKRGDACEEERKLLRLEPIFLTSMRVLLTDVVCALEVQLQDANSLSGLLRTGLWCGITLSVNLVYLLLLKNTFDEWIHSTKDALQAYVNGTSMSVLL